MAKTKLTLDIEEALYFYELEQGEVVVEEVSMPDDMGIVDTLTCRTKADGSHEWRCYEIKVSKADFRSTSKLSFVGHYNYYVLPMPLYEQVKEEIPSHVGAIVYLPYDEELIQDDRIIRGSLSIVKKASRQQLLVDEGLMLNSFLQSLFREVRKAKRVEKGLQMYRSDELFRELRKRYQSHEYKTFAPKENYFESLVNEMEQEAVTDLREELDATIQDVKILKELLREKRRKTEPLL